MRILRYFTLLCGFGTMGIVIAQEPLATPIHTISKDSLSACCGVAHLLKATGQWSDQFTETMIKERLEANRSDLSSTSWAEYLYTLRIPDTLKEQDSELLAQLKSNGAHLLGDLHASQSDYPKAITYYKEALEAGPYHSFDPSRAEESEHQTMIKLIDCYEKSGQTDEVYLIGLSRLLSNMGSADKSVLEQQLIRIAAKDKEVVKTSIDEGLKKVKILKVKNNDFGQISEEKFFIFKFNEKEIKARYAAQNPSVFLEDVRQTAFYQSLSDRP